MTTINLLALVVIAALNAVTAWLTYRTRSDIKILEHNTNSKLDRLITAEKKVSRAEGRKEGVDSQEGATHEH